jgi:hypothetical protein
VGYHVVGDEESLLQIPAAATQALNSAILKHAGTSRCPAILNHIFLVRASGGSGSVSQTSRQGSASTYSVSPATRDRSKEIELISWNRAQHESELADFGADAARQVIDLILERLEREQEHHTRTTARQAPDPKSLVAVRSRPANLQEVADISQPEEPTYADSMARYRRSCDEMRTVRLAPLKAIPWDNWPIEVQAQGAAIIHGKDPKRYAIYLHGLAVESERLVAQAKLWWTWWEESQVAPSKAGPEPLVSPVIADVLRLASRRRAAETAVVPASRDDDDLQTKPRSRRPANTTKYAPSSEAAVTSVVRAVAELRKANPNLGLTKERIKTKACKTGGAGDRAVSRAIDLGLTTPDYRLTALGEQFLAARS